MRPSNVDISRLPKFTSLDETVEYFNRFGKMTFWGWENAKPPYAVHTFKRKNGVEYFIDIQEDGQVSVIERRLNDNKDF
ncbi:hypothetical protein A8709_33105 [Paenibacillus pectinilyticus]|uniref:Uncharacterized protein n=1 Tax=Paenibacillus pectinilyticus TaxID=512399 RepID=A0A1C0ZX11_9BACL|nr:hypothetical protein [Paenibacillus pectinilyticus]OCT12651.1 hypothetical protein A8709_33105 [Paenibacillus pectinilyticus]